jgi:hypothetical protein
VLGPFVLSNICCASLTVADLEHLTSLNNAQKEALTQQINDATTVADVNQQSDRYSFDYLIFVVC